MGSRASRNDAVLRTDNITIHRMIKHHTAMLIVDQETSPLPTQRHQDHSAFCIILSNQKHHPDQKAEMQNYRHGIYLPCTTFRAQHSALFHPTAVDRRDSFFLAPAEWIEQTVLPQPDRQDWSSGFDAVDLCWVFGGDVKRTAPGEGRPLTVALLTFCVDI